MWPALEVVERLPKVKALLTPPDAGLVPGLAKGKRKDLRQKYDLPHEPCGDFCVVSHAA